MKREIIHAILADIESELDRAMNIHPESFHNLHEAYGVILEEVDELWDEIKKRKTERDLGQVYNEAIQVAAMAVRLIHDRLPERVKSS